MAEDARSRYLLAKLEKELVKLNIAFKGAVELEDDLKTLLQDVDDIKDLAANHTIAEQIVKHTVSSQSLISLYKEMKDKYYETKQLLDKYQDLIESTDLY
ncbi:MAG: hypothetical protein GOV15_04815, partial [Candidatus Diapherotrites archaeon]|nr:hypothetical protein [Candidatus Diapherotrites archaeon]